MSVGLPEELEVEPVGRPFDVALRLPGSKSLTNRALLLAALGEGESVVRRPLVADDTQRMLDALGELGFKVTEAQAGAVVRVAGRGGLIPADAATLELGNAGTAMRPLTAACGLGRGVYQLDGVARMRERPIGELVDPLRELGARVRYLGAEGYPPVEVAGRGLRGGEIIMRPTLSSQFITALLMVGPYMRDGLTIRFDGPVTSRPYVEMTIGLMARFGVEVQVDAGWRVLRVEPARYAATDYTVEPDASNASYFLAAAAALPGSRVLIEGLGRSSLQGDLGFVDVLARMGARLTLTEGSVAVASPADDAPLRGVDVDLNHMPDAAMTLATLAVLAEGPTTIRNVGNWRVKETDRMAAMHAELSKLGARVRVDGDDLHVAPPAGGRITPAVIDTYDDHRMAMSFAVIGLAQPGVVIRDPACVGKTFPGFFEHLALLRGGGAGGEA
ncbi:MAG: 3-phosphoshikimate 1-carboxyvinyltransferase [Phycisphaeraceae bacterium]